MFRGYPPLLTPLILSTFLPYFTQNNRHFHGFFKWGSKEGVSPKHRPKVRAVQINIYDLHKIVDVPAGGRHHGIQATQTREVGCFDVGYQNLAVGYIVEARFPPYKGIEGKNMNFEPGLKTFLEKIDCIYIVNTSDLVNTSDPQVQLSTQNQHQSSTQNQNLSSSSSNNPSNSSSNAQNPYFREYSWDDLHSDHFIKDVNHVLFPSDSGKIPSLDLLFHENEDDERLPNEDDERLSK